MFGSSAPYRDTGEMISASNTLGIAHPPGYPLYIILSKIFLAILPISNAGYRMNALSALCGALTVWIFYKILVKNNIERLTAYLISMIFAASYLQWYLSLVSEMYTLNTLFAVLLFYLLFSLTEEKNYKLIFLAAFLFGIGLGNRMDLLLILPGILWMVLRMRKHFSFSNVFLMLLLFCVGFSVYLYLPIRSSTYPLLDWNHPATLQNLIGSLTRKSHGGTLDLISSSYSAGENFSATMEFYFRHMWTGFAYLGIPMAIAGLFSLWKRKRDFAVSSLLAWIVSGPVFIYLANIPPNPHALAILEAHFLLSNVFAAFWIAEGFYFLIQLRQNRLYKVFVTGLCGVMLCVNLSIGFGDNNKRNNYFASDYAKNILRSAPHGSIVVMKEDVQLFSIWNKQLVENLRRDLAVVSQGLCGSPWYQRSFNALHPDVRLSSLRNNIEWKLFVEQNPAKTVYFTGDVDYMRPEGFAEQPNGLINRIARHEVSGGDNFLLDYIYAYRGKYVYTAHREFFTPDLIEDYAKARFQSGHRYFQKNDYKNARSDFEKALVLKPLFPIASNYLAFSYLSEGKYNQAKDTYLKTAVQYEEFLNLADEYNALSQAEESIRKDLSDVFISIGVCSEKLNEDDQSLKFYQSAIETYPNQPKAYFNRAVLFWKRNDWRNVISELQQALKLDPGYKEAEFYLNQSMLRMEQNN